ncbi:MAG TPA: glycosyltransferase family 39 protein [Methylomusa anaerophila]|uniref:Undecaprenyl phosphate-alpha-4-amino-4-deoxy-L-arabinose arabinosyl transferase n=1 Tax=Methylomusa anaerophila TaxID=1930071 RepID=A0A348AQE9_9FIRM|nr:glycosyltransferase family 39 protein [Methylomusa anaerophila]BBB93297.1 undecaprenyl phosphate-alpha-4-amino-4-deoxy-L-arabinose arabinosyl transferase [Methylomusa anaerophila]HML86872.1 glycosyltransferase family 39 protein [Methylomusa anaerophila]
MFRYTGTDILILAIVSSVIMFTNLGGTPLLDPDEPVYAQTSKEMIQYNDYISPQIFGEYWYDKPPMYYWLVAAAYNIFGINEFSARFPSAFLAVAGVLVLYLFGRELFSRRAAMTGALVLATSIEYFYLGKAAVTDITFNFCLMVSLLSFITKRYYLFYIFAGLATVTKGPIGLLFPGIIIFLYLLCNRSFRKLGDMKLSAGIIICSVVALPWYIAMYQIHGNAFIETFLGLNNVIRFTSPEHPEGMLWYYFVPVLIIGFFPWTAILVQSIWASLTKSNYEQRTKLIFLIIWTASIFLFFSVSRTKLISYILPMFPPLALIVGWYIDTLWAHWWERNTGWAILLAALYLLLSTGMFLVIRLMPELTTGIIVSAILFGIMTIVSVSFIWQGNYGRALKTQVIGMTLFSIVLITVVFSAAAPRFATKNIAREFAMAYDGQSPVYITKFLHPGFTFYAGIYGREIKDGGELSEALNFPGKAYFIVRQPEYLRLPANEQQVLSIMAQTDEKMVLMKK